MSLLLTILCCAVAVLIRARYRKTSWTMFGLGVLLLLGAGLGPVPALLLTHLQAGYLMEPPTPWPAGTDIVVLGLGTEKVYGHGAVVPSIWSYGRIVKSAELYQACRRSGAACRIIVSGGDPERNGRSEAVTYAQDLTRLGVPAVDMVLEDRSMNTWENAKNTSAILRHGPMTQTLLVTSGIHLRRSVLYFEHQGIKVLPIQADYLVAQPAGFGALTLNLLLTDAALHEYIGIWRMRLYDRMGWNRSTHRSEKTI